MMFNTYNHIAKLLDELPTEVRLIRIARGLSLRAAATEMGISFSLLHRFESGIPVRSNQLPLIIRWVAGPDPAKLLPTEYNSGYLRIPETPQNDTLEG